MDNRSGKVVAIVPDPRGGPIHVEYNYKYQLCCKIIAYVDWTLFSISVLIFLTMVVMFGIMGAAIPSDMDKGHSGHSRSSSNKNNEVYEFEGGNKTKYTDNSFLVIIAVILLILIVFALALQIYLNYILLIAAKRRIIGHVKRWITVSSFLLGMSLLSLVKLFYSFSAVDLTCIAFIFYRAITIWVVCQYRNELAAHANHQIHLQSQFVAL